MTNSHRDPPKLDVDATTRDEEIWRQCTAAIEELETHLRSRPTPDSFRDSIHRLHHAVAPLIAVEILCRSGDQEQSLGRSGCFPSDSVTLSREVPISSKSDLIVRLATSSQGAVCRRALEETLDAATSLFVSAFSRLELESAEQGLDALRRMASHLSSSERGSTEFYDIACEYAAALQADRLSLFIGTGATCQLVAVSVRPDFDRRAERVIESQRMAGIIGAIPDGDDESDGMHKIDLNVADQELAGYGNRNHVSELHWGWLADRKVLLVAEFADPISEHSGRITAEENSILNLALKKALAHRRPSVSDRLRTRWKNRSTRIWLAMIALLIVAGAFVPMRIVVTAEGRVVPSTQHTVYAPITGRVDTIDCESGQQVQIGQLLCHLVNDDLDFRVTQLQGEILTLQEKLEIASTRRVDQSVKDIASDRRVLAARLDELRKQLTILIERQAALSIHSPISGIVSLVVDGESGAFTAPRPVTVGQKVMRVIEPEDGYYVELHVPEREIGYLQQALSANTDQPIRCRYRIHSESEVERWGVVDQVEKAVTVDRRGQLVVPAKVIPDQKSGHVPADISVVSRIECNRAAAGFVLCRKLVEQLRLWGWL